MTQNENLVRIKKVSEKMDNAEKELGKLSKTVNVAQELSGKNTPKSKLIDKETYEVLSTLSKSVEFYKVNHKLIILIVEHLYFVSEIPENEIVELEATDLETAKEVYEQIKKM